MGRPPRSTEWEKAPLRRSSGYAARRRPAQVVKDAFGSWSAGLIAAGLEPLPPGGQRQERCRRGHPLSGENLVVRPNGKRSCRACEREGDRKRKRKDWPGRRAARQRKRLYADRWKAEGLCSRCGGERDRRDRLTCARCRAYLRDADTRRRAERREAA
jgi:hypothetical protein